MKYSLSIFTAVFATLAFLISCGGSEPGSIYGVVTDNLTGDPIKNAGVELLPVGLKTVTGSDGLFDFMDISSGHYNLLVTKTGYKDTKSDIVTVESGKAARADVHLEKNSALRIVDDAKNEISELDFGDKLGDISRSFNIFNDSPNSFEWEITKTAGWITSISQETGKLAAGDTQGIIVEIDRSLLREGENISQLHITAINNGDKRLTVKATDSDACKNNPCGEHGTCKATGVKTYKCLCDEGYFSNDIKCVDPCAEEPCIGLEHSTGKCVAKDAFSYSCECNDTFSWNGKKCLNPCDPNPCVGLEHSTEVCEKVDDFTKYLCGCTEGFFWSGEECLNPCESNPCSNKENSTGICTAVDAKTYSCECEDTFTWNENIKKCQNPCEPNPCAGIENSTEVCVKVDNFTMYTCECKETFTWNESIKKCQNPCEPNPCTGIENSIETCIKVDDFTKYTCECKDSFTWNENNRKCQNPCEPNPCIGIENSTETCIKVDDFTKYTCECEDTFTWNKNNQKCQNPCEPNPCAGIENSTETCIKVDNFTKYACECRDTFTWNENDKKCQNPCEPNPCAGIENSPEICVKEDEFTQYSCKCYKNFIWNGTQCTCMFPECSPTSNTPCVDSTSKLMWSSISSHWMNWEEANEYCSNLSEGDFADWRLPTISELRTLIRNCPATEPGGSCKVSDSCLAFSCWSEEDCSCVGIYDNEGYYSKLGDNTDIALWSSSTFSDMPDYAWYIGWGSAFVYGWAKVDTSDSYSPIRCVRKKTGTCF